MHLLLACDQLCQIYLLLQVLTHHAEDGHLAVPCQEHGGLSGLGLSALLPFGLQHSCLLALSIASFGLSALLPWGSQHCFLWAFSAFAASGFSAMLPWDVCRAAWGCMPCCLEGCMPSCLGDVCLAALGMYALLLIGILSYAEQRNIQLGSPEKDSLLGSQKGLLSLAPRSGLPSLTPRSGLLLTTAWLPRRGLPALQLKFAQDQEHKVSFSPGLYQQDLRTSLQYEGLIFVFLETWRIPLI